MALKTYPFNVQISFDRHVVRAGREPLLDGAGSCGLPAALQDLHRRLYRGYTATAVFTSTVLIECREEQMTVQYYGRPGDILLLAVLIGIGARFYPASKPSEQMLATIEGFIGQTGELSVYLHDEERDFDVASERRSIEAITFALATNMDVSQIWGAIDIFANQEERMRKFSRTYASQSARTGGTLGPIISHLGLKRKG